MKPALRRIAMERMEILMHHAVSNARDDPETASCQAMLARRISTRHRIRMPYAMRISFCKRCKSFIAPGVNSRIRLGRTSVKSIRISCRFCGHTYRKVIPARQTAHNA